MKLALSVYDKAEDRIIISKEQEIPNILDLFETADRLTAELVEAFSGIHIGYGSITLEMNGDSTGIEIYLDNILAGEDSFSLEKVLNGNYDFEVRQKRVLGSEVLMAEEVAVEENSELNLQVTIPGTTDRESGYASSHWKQIRDMAGEKEQQENLAALLSDIKSELNFRALPEYPDLYISQTLRDFRDRVFQEEALSRLRIVNWNIEDRQGSLARNIIEDAISVYKTADEYSVPQILREKVQETVSLYAYTRSLEANYALRNKDVDRAGEILEETDALRGYFTPGYLEKYEEEKYIIQKSLEEYETVKADPPGLFLPIVTASLGGILSLASPVLFLTDPAEGLILQADALYQEYLQGTDPDTLAVQHREIQRKYNLANAIEYVKWGGAAAGPALVGTGFWWMQRNRNLHFKTIKTLIEENFPEKSQLSTEVFDSRNPVYLSSAELNTEYNDHLNKEIIQQPEVSLKNPRKIGWINAGIWTAQKAAFFLTNAVCGKMQYGSNSFEDDYPFYFYSFVEPEWQILLDSFRIGPILSKNTFWSLLLNSVNTAACIIIYIGDGFGSVLYDAAFASWVVCSLTDLIITPFLVKDYNQKLINEKGYAGVENIDKQKLPKKKKLETSIKKYELGIQCGGHYNDNAQHLSEPVQAGDWIEFDGISYWDNGITFGTAVVFNVNARHAIEILFRTNLIDAGYLDFLTSYEPMEELDQETIQYRVIDTKFPLGLFAGYEYSLNSFLFIKGQAGYRLCYLLPTEEINSFMEENVWNGILKKKIIHNYSAALGLGFQYQIGKIKLKTTAQYRFEFADLRKENQLPWNISKGLELSAGINIPLGKEL